MTEKYPIFGQFICRDADCGELKFCQIPDVPAPSLAKVCDESYKYATKPHTANFRH